MTRYRCALAALMLFACSAVVGCQESDAKPADSAKSSPGADAATGKTLE